MTTNIHEDIKQTMEDLNKSFHVIQEEKDKEYHEKFKELTNENCDLVEKLNSLIDRLEKQDNKIKEQEKVIQNLEILESRSNTKACIKSNVASEYLERLDYCLKRLHLKNGNYDLTINKKLESKVLDYGLRTSKQFKIPLTNSYINRIKNQYLEGINPQGGYYLFPEWASTPVERIYETNPIRELAEVVAVNTNLYKKYVLDNLADAGGWIGETDEPELTSTSNLGVISVPVNKIYAYPFISKDALEDLSTSIVTYIIDKAFQIMNLRQNSAFLRGDGALEPKGILSYNKWGGVAVDFGDPSNYERNALEYIKSGQDGQVTADGYINLMLSLLAPFDANAVFMMSRKTWADTLNLKDSNNRPLYNIINFIETGATRPMLLGRPVRLVAPDLTLQNADGTPYTLPGIPDPASGSASVIYGDFNQGYLICDRLGFMVITDAITGKETVKYYVRSRLGGRVQNFQAFKILELSA